MQGNSSKNSTVPLPPVGRDMRMVVVVLCWLFVCKHEEKSVRRMESDCAKIWNESKTIRPHPISISKQQPSPPPPTQPSEPDTHVCWTHTGLLIGWPKVTDIICYGVRPKSHPRATGGLCSSPLMKTARRKGKEKANRRQTGLRRGKRRTRSGGGNDKNTKWRRVH